MSAQGSRSISKSAKRGRNIPKAVDIAIVNGELQYHPAVLHVVHGDSIAWSCGSGAFVIQFTGISPLEGAEFRPHDPPLPVRMEAASGTYPYAVAVYADGIVYVDAACPIIIVD